MHMLPSEVRINMFVFIMLFWVFSILSTIHPDRTAPALSRRTSSTRNVAVVSRIPLSERAWFLGPSDWRSTPELLDWRASSFCARPLRCPAVTSRAEMRCAGHFCPDHFFLHICVRGRDAGHLREPGSASLHPAHKVQSMTLPGIRCAGIHPLGLSASSTSWSDCHRNIKMMRIYAHIQYFH